MKHIHPGLSARLLAGLCAASICAAFICTACATTSGYWIPPKSFSASYDSPVDPIEEIILSTPATQLNPESQTTQTPPKDPANIGAGISPTYTPHEEESELPRKESAEVSNFGDTNPSVEIETVESASILYYAQAADTLPVVAVRFNVQASEIISNETIPETGFINPNQLLVIPRNLGDTTTSEKLLPDSEVVFSPSTVSFDIERFVNQAGGFLNQHNDYTKDTGTLYGAETVLQAAIENSINPRLLLALLEFHSGWVYGQPANQAEIDYPLGVDIPTERYLYNQLVWTVNQLSTGYYAYREGRLTEITFKDGGTARLAPDLNAGTAALQYYFAQLYDYQEWQDILYSPDGFISLHERMFGDPWERAASVEPLFPIAARQPPLILPFERNWTWSLTGGPHGAWEHDGAYAALDFGPGIQTSGCVESGAWVLAASDGLVVRTGPGLVVVDLDGDGHEQTGWVLVYLHVASDDRIPVDTWVATGDKLGHPSCEGGFSTGTHLHFARKFNGEWVPADGPLPFNLGGWIAHNGEEAYKGTLTRDGETVIACTCSNAKSFVTRGDDDP